MTNFLFIVMHFEYFEKDDGGDADDYSDVMKVYMEKSTFFISALFFYRFKFKLIWICFRLIYCCFDGSHWGKCATEFKQNARLIGPINK